MSKAIPRNLLIHSATYGVITTDRYGNKTTVETDLTRVRFEPVVQNAWTALGEARDDKFLMFFDVKNSRPIGQEFNKLDKIIFDGVELSIRVVTPEYDNEKLHHYEIALN